MKRILWFRRDLRISDNKILSFAGEVLPIFIFDKNILQHLETDDKRLTFIYHYVLQLKSNLKEIGLDLKIFHDTPQNVFEKLLQEYDFDEVIASGDYDSYAKQRDLEISHKIHFRYINETYLFKPKEILKKDGTPYLVFTPYFKTAMKILEQKDLKAQKIAPMQLLETDYEYIPSLQQLGFIQQNIQITPPYKKLERFKEKLPTYKEERDYMMRDATSQLSVDLRFGTIGTRELVRVMGISEESYPFIRQLLFREFYAYILFHFPALETKNFKYTFNGIYDQEKYEKFINAKTGFAIVDAGVTELLKTGNMHNRVRMIVASFFTKDLLLPWQLGEAFFAKHLLDYDKASNVLSWQWSAGTGVDPQPYFRIFNPHLQTKKFDPDQKYIKHYIVQDENYPEPIVNHKEAARKAIEAFKTHIS